MVLTISSVVCGLVATASLIWAFVQKDAVECPHCGPRGSLKSGVSPLRVRIQVMIFVSRAIRTTVWAIIGQVSFAHATIPRELTSSRPS